MKVMISVFLLMASPVAAVRLNMKQPAGVNSAESVMRKVGQGKNQTWISFMGDSNMRNTYWWWVTSMNKTGAKLIRSKQFSFTQGQSLKDVSSNPHLNSQWSDQEAVLEFPDGFEVRTSFRFLHGGDKEFQLKTKEWNKALFTYNENVEDMDKEMGKVMQLMAKEKAIAMDDSDAIQPSKRALLMTHNSKFINFDVDVPALGRKFKKYENSKPDIVILTEGWGGIPGCERTGEVLDIFKKNPEVKFVWAPVYMTNRIKKRKECFAQKIASVPKDAKRNFRYVDMWDLAEKIPMGEPGDDRVARGTARTKHMPLGGDYMTTACQRFESAIVDLAQ
jgi:hypothetical protein